MAAAASKSLSWCAPASARWWRPGAAPRTPAASRPCGAGGASCRYVIAPDAERSSSACMANCAWPAAGAPSWLLSSALPAINAQLASSRSVSRPGSTSGAVRQFRDGGEQLGGRRHRAGGAGGDHRRVAAGEALGFGLDQLIAALGRFDGAALVAQCRPGVARDFEKIERELPIGIEIARHQAVELAPRHLARGHVVHQAGEVVGKTERGGRRVGDQRGAVGAAHGRRIRPFQDQFGQQQPPLERRDRRRQRQRGFGQFAGGGFGEGDFVFVQIAERDDARQDGGVALEFVEEHRRARAGRRAGSADRALSARVRADRCWPESRAPVCRRAAHRSAPAETAPRRGC